MPVLQQSDGQGVLESDLRWLPAETLAEGTAAVIGQTFQIDGMLQTLQQAGFGTAGLPRDNHETMLRRSFQLMDQIAAHGLVTADDPRIGDTRFLQPLLADAGAQPAPEAVEIAIGMDFGECLPCRNPAFLDCALHQSVTERDRGLLTFLFVTKTDLGPFVILHQGQIDRIRKRALGEFPGRTGIDHRGIGQEQPGEIAAIRADQRRRTQGPSVRACRRPMQCTGTSADRSTASRVSAASGATAISRPPLVCGSHSSAFW